MILAGWKFQGRKPRQIATVMSGEERADVAGRQDADVVEAGAVDEERPGRDRGDAGGETVAVLVQRHQRLALFDRIDAGQQQILVPVGLTASPTPNLWQ